MYAAELFSSDRFSQAVVVLVILAMFMLQHCEALVTDSLAGCVTDGCGV